VLMPTTQRPEKGSLHDKGMLVTLRTCCKCGLGGTPLHCSGDLKPDKVLKAAGACSQLAQGPTAGVCRGLPAAGCQQAGGV